MRHAAQEEEASLSAASAAVLAARDPAQRRGGFGSGSPGPRQLVARQRQQVATKGACQLAARHPALEEALALAQVVPGMAATKSRLGPYCAEDSKA